MKILDIINEVSRGDYYKKATMDKAMNQMSAGFAKSPEEREQHLQKAGRRERGLARAKVRTDKFWAEKNAKDQADALERDRARKPEMIARLKDLEAQFDPSYEYSDDYSEWHKHKQIHNQIGAPKQRLAQLDENATAGATNAANVGTVVNPHHSPGKARGKKSYIGDPWGGKSGTKSPPQPKVVQPKNSDGTAKNGADSANLFGAGAVKRR